MSVLNILLKKHRNRVGLAYFASGLALGLFCSVGIALHNNENSGSLIRNLKINGWKEVNVFFGDSNHIKYDSVIPNDYFDSVEWYSQARQDEVVAALLRNKRNGYFIDLASNDAVKISNTYALETKLGWRGLCMEPNPMYWAGLAYRKCDIVGAVVGSNRMEEIQFKFPNRAGTTGSIVGEQFDNKEASKFGEDKPRYTVTLLEIFERFDTPPIIDYLSLDVEGGEDFIMAGFPFEKYRFNIITLERPKEGLQALLPKHGYRMLRKLKENSGETLWIHKSMEGKLDIEASCKIDTRRVYSDKKPGPLPDEKGNFCEK